MNRQTDNAVLQLRAIDQLPRLPVTDGRQGLLARGIFRQFGHQPGAVPIALRPETRQMVAITFRAVKKGCRRGQRPDGN